MINELKTYAATDAEERQRAGRVQALFDGAQAGHYSLPPELLEAAKTEANVREQAREARGALKGLGPTGAAIGRIALDVVAAARHGKPLADLADRIAQAEQAERLGRVTLHVLVEAEEQARSETLNAASSNEIIVRCLQPALAEVLTAVRAIAPKLANHDVSDAASFVRAAEPARRAFTTLQDTMTRHAALRAAQRRLSIPQVDRAGWFSELRDPAAHGVKLGGPASTPQPWPSDPAARLLWLAALPEGSVWMPTASQQDTRAAEYLEEASRKRRGRGVAVAGGW